MVAGLAPEDPPSDAATVELARLIDAGEALITGPIRQELLSGIATGLQFELLRERLAAFPDIPLGTLDFERAASCSNQCRARGIQGSNTDFLICALALRLDLPVFSTDLDFARYAHLLGVRMHAGRVAG